MPFSRRRRSGTSIHSTSGVSNSAKYWRSELFRNWRASRNPISITTAPRMRSSGTIGEFMMLEVETAPSNRFSYTWSVESGSADPLGATLMPGGANFSLYARNAEGVDLLLFDREDDAPTRVIRLDPEQNLSYHYWHIFV